MMEFLQYQSWYVLLQVMVEFSSLTVFRCQQVVNIQSFSSGSLFANLSGCRHSLREYLLSKYNFNIIISQPSCNLNYKYKHFLPNELLGLFSLVEMHALCVLILSCFSNSKQTGSNCSVLLMEPALLDYFLDFQKTSLCTFVNYLPLCRPRIMHFSLFLVMCNLLAPHCTGIAV